MTLHIVTGYRDSVLKMKGRNSFSCCQNKTGIKYSIKQFVYQISGTFNKLLNCNSSHNIAMCGLNVNGEKTRLINIS